MNTDYIDEESFEENFDLDISDSEELDIELDDIELDSVDDDVLDEEVTEEESEVVLSKHQIQDKHRLKYDSIFKGKKEDPMDDFEMMTSGFNETFEVDRQSNYWFESIDNEIYVRD